MLDLKSVRCPPCQASYDANPPPPPKLKLKRQIAQYFYQKEYIINTCCNGECQKNYDFLIHVIVGESDGIERIMSWELV